MDPSKSIKIKGKVIVDKGFVSEEGILYHGIRMSIVFIPYMLSSTKWPKGNLYAIIRYTH